MTFKLFTCCFYHETLTHGDGKGRQVTGLIVSGAAQIEARAGILDILLLISFFRL